MALYNRIDGRLLKEKMRSTPEKRVTISFYKYHHITEPHSFRDELYRTFDLLGVLGRIYIASEGINAQISVPEANLTTFKEKLYAIEWLNQVRLNIAVDDNGKSFSN